MNKEKIYWAAAIIIFILELFMAVELRSIRQELTGNMAMLQGKVNQISIDTDGRLIAMDKKYEKMAEAQNTQVIRTEVAYIPKSDRTDADIEIRDKKPKVTVKVNDGKKYSFDLLENETSKFDSGKLVLEKSASYNLNLVTDEYKKSRWSVTTALNADKEALFGISYNLGRSVSADIFVGQHIKPYYGFTWSIGSKN